MTQKIRREQIKSPVTMDYTTLTNDSAATLSTWEDWGTETISLADPGLPIKVSAIFTGYTSAPTGRRDCAARVLISLDGGSSFTSGGETFNNTGATDVRKGALSCQHYRTGTPTGNVVIKVQLNQNVLGTAGDVDFVNGAITAFMVDNS